MDSEASVLTHLSVEVEPVRGLVEVAVAPLSQYIPVSVVVSVVVAALPNLLHECVGAVGLPPPVREYAKSFVHCL
jgi:hypothetical protein